MKNSFEPVFRQPEPSKEQEHGLLKGAHIFEVVVDSPASLAGLQSQDIILEVDHQPVNDAADVPRLIEKKEQAQLTIFRKGKIINVKVNTAIVEGRVRLGVMLSQVPLEKKIDERTEAGYILISDTEIVDDEGRPVCKTRIEYDPKAHYSDGKETKSHRVLSYTVVAEQSGTAKDLDLLQTFNTANAEVYAYYERSMKHRDAYGWCQSALASHSLVFVPLNSRAEESRAYDIHALLHELRHAQQRQNEEYKTLAPRYIRFNAPDEIERMMTYEPDLFRAIKDIITVLPESLSPKDSQALRTAIQQMDSSLLRRFELLSSINKKEERSKRIKGIDASAHKQKIQELEDHLKEAQLEYDTAHEIFLSFKKEFPRLLRLPAAVLERDAEAWALFGTRLIKKWIGVNLLTLGDIEAIKAVEDAKVRIQAGEYLDKPLKEMSQEEKLLDKDRALALIDKELQRLKNGKAIRDSVQAYMQKINATPSEMRYQSDEGHGPVPAIREV